MPVILVKEDIYEKIEKMQEIIYGKEANEIDDIDIYELEVEWRHQARMYRKWSKRLADSKRIVNKIEELIDIRKASVDRNVRRQPSKYGLEKITNEALSNICILDAEHKELKELLVEAKYLVDVLFGNIISLEHRRDGLLNEVKLHLANYYAEQDLPMKAKSKLEDEAMGKEREEQIRGLNENKRLQERRNRTTK